MDTSGIIWPVIGILFLASLVRSTLGFGQALIAVPLMAFLMPVEIAAPTAVLVSIVISTIILTKEWHSVQVRGAGWLAVSTFCGIPVGLFLLKTVPEEVAKTVLAVIVIAFAGFSLTHPRIYFLKDDRFAWIFGFHAGVFGGAYGMNGPPLAIYGAMRRWQPREFRATLQAYFLPASIVGMTGYWFAGLWTPPVNRFFAVSLPGVVIATLLGQVLSRRVKPQAFTRAVWVGLLLTGLGLLIQAWA